MAQSVVTSAENLVYFLSGADQDNEDRFFFNSVNGPVLTTRSSKPIGI